MFICWGQPVKRTVPSDNEPTDASILDEQCTVFLCCYMVHVIPPSLLALSPTGSPSKLFVPTSITYVFFGVQHALLKTAKHGQLFVGVRSDDSFLDLPSLLDDEGAKKKNSEWSIKKNLKTVYSS